MLNAGDAPRGEAAAVAHALDVVDNRPRGVARQQEVAVQRVGDPLRRHSAYGGHQRLAQHLPAKDALPAVLRAAAAKQVLLQRLQVQNGQKIVERAAGLGVGRFGGLARHGGTS